MLLLYIKLNAIYVCLTDLEENTNRTPYAFRSADTSFVTTVLKSRRQSSCWCSWFASQQRQRPPIATWGPRHHTRTNKSSAVVLTGGVFYRDHTSTVAGLKGTSKQPQCHIAGVNSQPPISIFSVFQESEKIKYQVSFSTKLGSKVNITI